MCCASFEQAESFKMSVVDSSKQKCEYPSTLLYLSVLLKLPLCTQIDVNLISFDCFNTFSHLLPVQAAAKSQMPSGMQEAEDAAYTTSSFAFMSSIALKKSSNRSLAACRSSLRPRCRITCPFAGKVDVLNSTCSNYHHC